MRKSDLVFFLTGSAALVYETVWIRLLARLVGSSAGGLAVVLAIFMGGMGLGAWLAAGPARRVRRPELVFAGLELGLGVWAALSPFMLSLVDPLEGLGARLALGAFFLLPPTLAMGATFPLMGRLTIRSREEAGEKTSAFYGANCLGAACGALLGPILFMPLFGLSGALFAAAALDGIAALLAWRWFRAAASDAARVPLSRAPLLDPFLIGTLLLGFCGLALEVILARLLVTVTGASVYAYAIVLFVFLTGIGLGSRQLAKREDPRGEGPGKSGLRAGARTFQLAALFLPALTLLGLLALRWQLGESDLFGALQNRMPSGAGVWKLWATHAFLAALALLPPALALGMALPSAAAAVLERHPEAGAESVLARVYAFNTAGALAGSLVAAFVLLPSWGPEWSIVALLGASLAAGVIVPPGLVAARGAALLAALVLATLLVGGESNEAVLHLEHDTQATVSVERSFEENGAELRSLRVNGKVVATTAPVDLRLQRLLGQVPSLLHGEVKRALVIGLGTGMTAGSLLDFPALEELEVYEISAAVLRAAREFAAWNGAVVDDPRTTLRVADGRHALAVSDEQWDLITSDPIHPWTRGSSDLYALEHFERMAAHLAPGGVASQWLPLYQLSSRDVKTIVATWCAAFPHTSAWLTAYDLALVGSRAPLPGEASPATLAFPPRVALHLSEAGVHSAAELVALLVADDAALREFSEGSEPMRDDRPTLEFRAPLSYLGGYCTEVLRWAAREEFVEELPAESRERAREVRAILHAFLDAIPDGLSAAARAYGEELLALPPVEQVE